MLEENYVSILFAWVAGLLLMVIVLVLPVAAAAGEVKLEPGTIRVGLIQQAPSIEFAVEGSYRVVDMKSNQVVAALKTGERWQVRATGSRLELTKNGVLAGVYTGPLQVNENNAQVAVLSSSGTSVVQSGVKEITVLGAEERSVSVKDFSGMNILSAQGQSSLDGLSGLNLVTLYSESGSRRYRGNLEVRADDQGLTAINELPVEEYMYGVIASEMPASWPLEALKAQAVAARSYALTQLGAYGKYGFDLLATQSSQVYNGYDGEAPAASRAVDETRGIVMTYRGKLISAVFHSSSGGFTENSEDVWIYPLDYLRAKSDSADANDKHYNWKVVYSKEQLINQLSGKGYVFSDLYDMTELERTSTGARVKRLAIKGLDTKGNSVVKEVYNADAVRIALGLKSALFTMKKVFDQQKKLLQVTITGSGWGHGLGMSQYGALGLAKKGYSYQDILKYYYTGITLSKDYGG